ncbi:hypothetical protein OCK02_10715 [Rhizobium sp. TRM96647]|uniref:calcium-binding protein n=1 Tax=unclassified Rhizobium TaxID=2613769 RepID=UPI0021E89276|nr:MULTISPECIES: calcium-binding protein [unclassified Rhizobium]MCV3736677.1 hypothetical protein [Rhizobium sp. TRM96647]MCV3756923.1 hypothetical protein [Rhizobium sp. TRM96650]
MAVEFRVNSYQGNWQDDSNVLALRGGGFLVTWSSYLNEYDDSDSVATYVAGQFYDASGRPSGGETVMRGIIGAHSGSPQATQLKNGNIVVTWAEALDDAIFSNGAHIMAQIFDTKGARVTGAFQVDTVSSFEALAPDVVATGDGGFVVSFGLDRSQSRFDEVYSRAYTASGQARGRDKVLNTKSYDFDELLTKSTALTNGNSVIIWNSEAAINDGTNDGRNQLRASLLDEKGRVIKSDFALTPHKGGAGGFWSDSENYGYSVAARAGGGFAVVNLDWTKSDDDDAGSLSLYFSAYDDRGRKVTAATPIFEKGTVVGDLEMARLTTGQYVVTWTQDSLVASDIGDDAYGLILSASGKPLSKVFEVGIDADRYDDQQDVSVAALSGGGFVITYTSDSIDIDDEGIAGMIFGRGTAGADDRTVDATGMLSGLDGDDRLKGDGRANVLSGGRGDDTLLGKKGADELIGGTGADKLSGGSGTDTASYAGANKGVVASLAKPSTNTREAKGDSYSSIENLTGSSHSDTLTGDKGANRISGGSGNDKIYGGAGKDVLIGDSGKDKFVFNTKPGSKNVDRIDDFSVKDDVIWLDNDVFTRAGKVGDLASKAFHIGARAHDKDDRVIYDSKNGKLWYDRDGTGSSDAILFATLDKKLKMTAGDFDILA